VCPNSLSPCRLNYIPATLHGNYPIVVPQFDFSNIKFPLSLTPRMEVGDNIDRCISAKHNLVYTQDIGRNIYGLYRVQYYETLGLFQLNWVKYSSVGQQSHRHPRTGIYESLKEIN